MDPIGATSVSTTIPDGYYALDSEWRFVEMDNAAEQTRAAGFQFHLTKPTEPEEVQQLLEAIAAGAPLSDRSPVRPASG